MRGEYKVKHPGLQPLAARARLLIGQLDDVTFQHVRREQNKEADRLSNLGMDQAEAALREEPAPDARPVRSRLGQSGSLLAAAHRARRPNHPHHPARARPLRSIGVEDSG